MKIRIAITGASGFVGSWLTRLLADDHEVYALVRDSSNLKWLVDIPNIRIINGGLECWRDFVAGKVPDVLILNHWSGVGNSERNSPRQHANVNRILGLIDAALVSDLKCVIGVGSQAELGPLDYPITEIESDNPTNSYGKAKVTTRLAIQNRLKNTDMRFIWMRIFSTYGPLDEGLWLIPKIVDSLLRNEVMKLTKGEQEWSYLHPYDLATAFKKVIENSEVAGIINVGNPQTISIRDAALTIGKILEKEELLEFGALRYRPDQVMRLQPLCETLTKYGWRPQISFEQGVQQTIQWLQRKELQPIVTENGQALNFKLPVRP